MKAHIRLISSNGTYFDIPEKVVFLYPTIPPLINGEYEVPLEEVSVYVFPLIVEWALKHLNDMDMSKIDQDTGTAPVKLDEWDILFLQAQHPLDLMELIVAANYLGNMVLRDLAARRIAEIIGINTEEENEHFFGDRAQELLDLITRRVELNEDIVQ